MWISSPTAKIISMAKLGTNFDQMAWSERKPMMAAVIIAESPGHPNPSHEIN
jgi:hypothetical protein